MIEKGDFQVFEKGETVPSPPDIESNFQIISKFGLKIVTIDGKKMWQAGTEEDYIEAEQKRTGRTRSEIVEHLKSAHAAENTCRMFGPNIHVCVANCFDPGYPQICRLYIYNPGRYYYCACG